MAGEDKTITQLTEYTTPVDADVLPIVENATITTKKISWATIKSALSTYFATLFITKNTAITGSTKTKVTYDANGLVTVGADATTADIPDSANRRYCTDAQKTIVSNTSGTNSGAETAQSIGNIINVSTVKSTLTNTDRFGVMDSAAGNILKHHTWANLKTGITTLLGLFYNAATSSVSAGYATDTYLAGSAILVSNSWQTRNQYRLVFDMTKTAAGTAAFTITVRLGTTGTTSDTAILTLTFGAGTAAIDTGLFEVFVTFRTVGASAVIQGVAKCSHHLAATGLISTGASGCGIVIGTSAGFDSSSATMLGVSVNGGTSFSGTCTTIQSHLLDYVA